MTTRVKLLHLIMLFCISLLFSCGFKPDSVEIQERIYSALKVGIQEDYILIDSGEDGALDDYRQYFTIKFNQSGYTNFVKKIDLSKWVNAGGDSKLYQYTHQLNNREIYRLSLSITDKTLEHEYIRE